MHKTSFSIHNYILTNKRKQAPQSPGIETLSAVCVCAIGVFETGMFCNYNLVRDQKVCAFQ